MTPLSGEVERKLAREGVRAALTGDPELCALVRKALVTAQDLLERRQIGRALTWMSAILALLHQAETRHASRSEDLAARVVALFSAPPAPGHAAGLARLLIDAARLDPANAEPIVATLESYLDR